MTSSMRSCRDSEDALVMVDMRRYEGAEDLKTLWEEFRFVTSNKNSVDKIAIIGKLDWQKLATLIVSPFTRAHGEVLRARGDGRRAQVAA